MATSWWKDFGKAALVMAGLALVIGYHEDLRASSRQSIASLSRFAASLISDSPVQTSAADFEPVEPGQVELAQLNSPDISCGRAQTTPVLDRPENYADDRSCH